VAEISVAPPIQRAVSLILPLTAIARTPAIIIAMIGCFNNFIVHPHDVMISTENAREPVHGRTAPTGTKVGDSQLLWISL